MNIKQLSTQPAMVALTTAIACFSPIVYPANLSLAEAKHRLKELDIQIDQTEQALQKAHDQRTSILSALDKAERRVKQDDVKLESIQVKLLSKQRKAKELQLETDKLADTLKKQQNHLSAQVQARYKLGQQHPIQWLISHHDTNDMEQLLTFYHYLVTACQRSIRAINETNAELTTVQRALQYEIATIKKTQRQLYQHQLSSEKNKQHRETLLTQLETLIHHEENKLTVYQQDKKNLTALLLKLVKKSTIQTRHSFSQMRNKLPSPVNTKTFHEMNQGLIFLAKEGSSVNAIYPGEVVFSDWLRGYGLLLIVDHGWGFMTLYAYNQSLHKRKGDTVQQGEQIAEVGHTGTLHQNGLYFEIRHHGKAISPMGWLS